jgi:hypothetical protein
MAGSKLVKNSAQSGGGVGLQGTDFLGQKGRLFISSAKCVFVGLTLDLQRIRIRPKTPAHERRPFSSVPFADLERVRAVFVAFASASQSGVLSFENFEKHAGQL